MKTKIKVGLSASVFTLIAFGAMQGCNSGSTSGAQIDHNSGQYTGEGTGAIELVFTDGDTIPVASMQGFRIYATDAKGAPAPDLLVTCDSEKGLAIIEPTTGKEYTDSNGQMSGKIGCEDSGSFVFACRLPAGTGKRVLKTIKCTGERPEGFSGFAGAAGGGLGGGTSDKSRVAISLISVSDDGTSSSATTSIDITQGACISSGTITAEPFFDSSVKFTVVNDSSNTVTFTSMTYKVTNPNGAGGTYTSPRLGLVGSASASASGGQVELTSLLFDANSGGKRFYGSSSNIATEGIRNIEFTLYGSNDLGQDLEVTGSTNLSFDNFNRCD